MTFSMPPPPTYYPQNLAPSPGSSLGHSISDQTIEKRITSVSYSALLKDAVTICTVVLDNGYTVWGACACSMPEANDPVVAEQCAYQEALRTLRTLFGFLATECQYLYLANTTYLGGKP